MTVEAIDPERDPTKKGLRLPHNEF